MNLKLWTSVSNNIKFFKIKYSLTSFGEDVDKLELLCTAGRFIVRCNYYVKQYGGSSKTKIRTTIYSTILLLDIYPKELKVKVSRGYLHIHVHSSPIHNSQIVEANQLSIKQTNGLTKCGIYIQRNIIQP